MKLGGTNTRANFESLHQCCHNEEKCTHQRKSVPGQSSTCGRRSASPCRSRFCPCRSGRIPSSGPRHPERLCPLQRRHSVTRPIVPIPVLKPCCAWMAPTGGPLSQCPVKMRLNTVGYRCNNSKRFCFFLLRKREEFLSLPAAWTVNSDLTS